MRRVASAALVGLVLLAACGCKRAPQDVDRRARNSAVLGVVGTSDNLNFLLNRAEGAREVEAAMQRGFTRYDEHWTEQPQWAMFVPSKLNRLESGGSRHVTLTYSLRPHAQWSDKLPLTNDDFMFTYEMGQLLPPTQVPSWLQHMTYRSSGENLVSVTFDPTSGDPRGELLPLPAHFIRPLIQQDVGQFLKFDFNHTPLSSGPFLIDTNADGRVDLAPNPGYLPSKCGLAHLIVRFFPDRAARLAAVQAGEVDCASGLDAADAVTLVGKSSLQVDMTPDGTVWCLAFPTQDAAFQDRVLRQFLVSLIDRKAVAQQVQGPQAILPQSWLPPQHPAYEAAFTALTPMDQWAALKAGVDKLGYKKSSKGEWTHHGEPWKVELLVLEAPGLEQSATQSASDAMRAGQAVQKMWQTAGLQVELTEVSRAQLSARLSQHAAGAIILVPLDVGPQTQPGTLFSAQNAPAAGNGYLGRNVSGWNNPQNEKVCTACAASDVPGERWKLLAQQQRLVAMEVPLLPLFYGLDYSAHDKDLLGVNPRGRPDVTWNAEDWHWK